MNYIFDNERPIYVQLVEKIRFDIISGKLKPNSRIPSVRDLALSIKVNPNTIQKALIELENDGLIYTERTNGKYVTENKKLIEKTKKELAKQKVHNYLKDMQELGISYENALKYLEELGGNK